ncbi:hypothetical protein [Paenibacillus flagellatus]|uniref:Fibronectin type-III domain-containing protein n=1 Tax=Paenibacillus flagellatus TaxID=2211139 RepID=A0A2V5K859_9BACL|nr:hypothetical protein [Paenibacillus flagellatus]PYI55651.1 hypothetical protein DLM86_07945 [Paenibacillus flagellatus]
MKSKAKWKKGLIGVAAAALLGTSLAGGGGYAYGETAGVGSTSAVAAESAPYDEILQKEAQWIAGLAFESGAIPTYGAPISNYGGKYRVVPYFTNMALLGLLERPEHAQTVRRYADWYFSRLNRTASADVPAGSVFDYIVETDRTTETATGDFDSTDSYASTFLNVLRKYAAVTGDTAYLRAHEADIRLIAQAMLSTQQADGLTWAKPAYRVKYLMDNTEVYKGLVDAEWIASSVFGDATAAAEYRRKAEEVKAGIENGLWSADRQAYAYAKMEDGSLLYPDWNSFYADATAQLFPIWTGLIAPDSERAMQLYRTFNEHHPGWPLLDKGDAFPWALLAYTAAIMGDRTRVDAFLQSVKATYVDRDHPWPWYVMESGVTMLAAAKMKSASPEPRSWTVANLKDGDSLGAMPYTVEGTSQGVDRVELKWTNGQTGQSRTFAGQPDGGGVWRIAVEGLTNGRYAVQMTAKDRFANVVASASAAVDVRVGGGPVIGKAVVASDRDVLRRGESTTLRVTAYGTDGRTPIDLSGADIAYRIDRPDLATVDADGKLTLLGLAEGADRLSVDAFVTLGHDVTMAEPAVVNVSREPVSMADDVLDRMSAWISARQLDDGAIATDAGGTAIVPSVSNVGARGLLLRHETVPNAVRYIDWYTSRWNWGDRYGLYGTMYESRFDPASGRWTSTGGYDSASVNLASFITLLRASFEKTGQFKLPQSNLDLMTGGVGMMRSQDADGLMWKLPDEKTKRLRDNALALRGMTDSVWLFRNRFQAEGPAGYFDSFRESLRAGMQSKLWNEGAGWYYAAINDREEKSAPDWTDKRSAAEQLAPIYAGIVPATGDIAARLYAAFNRSFPDWASGSAVEPGDAAVAYAAALTGDTARASSWLALLLDAAKGGALPMSWTVEDAGYAMLAAELVRQAPSAVTVAVDSPGDGAEPAGRSLAAKGTAAGAERVRVEWRERFGRTMGAETVNVGPNGKWHVQLHGLNRGSAYELTVTAVDRWGYDMPYARKSVSFSVRDTGGKPK